MSATAGAVLDPVIGRSDLPPREPPSLGEGPFRSGAAAQPPPVSNARIGMLAFIVFEAMLFAGLLGGFTVLRWGSAVWRPPGQPYLPIGVSWLNTALLLASCAPLLRAGRALRRGASRHHIARPLLLASSLGAIFLAVQGVEWARLLAHGLTVQKGVYGASFLLLIGTHGLHVLGAVIWLGIVALMGARGRIVPGKSAMLEIVTMYWIFVCAVWLALFAMVYLA